MAETSSMGTAQRQNFQNLLHLHLHINVSYIALLCILHRFYTNYTTNTESHMSKHTKRKITFHDLLTTTAISRRLESLSKAKVNGKTQTVSD